MKKILQGTIWAILIFSFSACHNLFKGDDEPETIYLVDYEIIQTYTPTTIELFLNAIVSENPELAFLQENATSGFYVYRITYKTTFEGEPKLASGIVAAPFGEGPYPTISYQNGTNTLHSNAPSVSADNYLYKLLEFVSSTGFVVSMPDYLGFGSSDNMFHPYLHKESTVQTVLDMLRAVRELAAIKDFSINNELYLTGYSQGGWATMQVQKAIENQFANEFDLKASAPGAGPYDLNFINESILSMETYPMPYFTAYMFNSYMNLDEMFTPIDSVFNYPYDSIVPTLFDGTLSGVEINEFLTTSVEELFTENYRQNYDSDTTFTSLQAALTSNSVEVWNLTTPTRIIHGTADDFVPYGVSEKIYQDFTAAGVSSGKLELIPLPEKNHTEGIVPAGLLAIQWFIELAE